MHERGKSDSPVVPAKPPNKAGRPVAEVVEERGLAEGNTDRPDTSRTQCRARRAKRVGSCARSSTKGQGRTVHSAAAPRRPRASRAAYCGDQPEGRTGSRPGDVGRLRRRTSRQPRRPAPPGPQRRLPGEPVSAGVHTEVGRAQRPLGIATLEDEDPPAGPRRGAERHFGQRPPIEPCVPFSGTRLSDIVHRSRRLPRRDGIRTRRGNCRD